MNIVDQLKKDIHQSIVDKDSKKSESLRYLLSLIQKQQAKLSTDLSEDQVVAILAKEMKQKKEAKKSFLDGGRSDLAEKETEEIDLLEKYLPKQASEEEIKEIVTKVVSQQGKDNFGKVMGAVMAELKGKADGNLVQSIVKQELS